MNARRLVVVGLALVGLGAGCGSDEPPPVGAIGFSVVHYDYAFDVESREAASAITLSVETGGDCLALPARVASVGEVTLDEPDAEEPEVAEPVTLEGDALTACGRGWHEGTTLVLRVATTIPEETWGTTQVGFSTTTDLEGAPFDYLVSWVGGCDRFGPCDNAPDRFATYSFTVRHPAGSQALCPGRITAGETETRCEFDYPGGPTYSTFGVAVSPSWEVTELGDWGGVRATLYDHPSSGVADQIDPDYHAGFLAWMADRFGPYPYGDELRLFVGPTHWNGFEHPGNIALSDQLPSQNSAYADPLGHTVNHELAHMWAGDQTTLAGTYDFVWKEAMAEYLSMVYDEEERDPLVGLTSAAAWKGFSRFAEYHPVPDERPELLDYYGDAYGPGPMILFRQLEALFGRDAIFDALGMLLGSERALSVEDVKSALTEATGADLTGYFDSWLHGEGAPVWPLFEVEVADAGGDEVEVTVTQVNVAEAGLRGCAFAVRLRGESNDQSHDVWFDLGTEGAETMTLTATPGFEVTRWIFDADFHSLALERRTMSAAPPERRNPWVASDWLH